MTDKLYQRRKIRIPSLKFKKVHPFKKFLLIFFSIIIICVSSFIYTAFPIFKASCESAAGSLATRITNQSVINVMKKYTYNDFFNIEKDNNGKIILLEGNTVLINQATAEIVESIQSEIDNSPKTTVYINMGSVSGISNLKTIGPKFDIELETAGRITTQIRTEFKSVGINQTLHRIYLDSNANIGILTPYGSFSRNFETSVLLTQTIIVGEIPETFYDFDGMTEPGEAYEMIG